MKVGDWYDRYETYPEYRSAARKDRKRGPSIEEIDREFEKEYGIKEGDLVAFVDHEPDKTVLGLLRGDRMIVDVPGLFCRLLPGGTYVDVDKLVRVDSSLGVFIRRWDSRGSYIGNEVRRLTTEESETQLQFADEMYKEFLRRKEKK